MIQYLKDRAYYENLYDHATIRKLKGWEKSAKERVKKWEPDFSELMMMFVKMERYEQREERIQKWIKDDKARDDFQENTQPGSEIIRCKLCNNIMEYYHKDFDENYNTWKFRMLFFYRCEWCKKWRGIYNTGEEFESPKETCKKCWKVAEYNGKFEWDILIKTITCEYCNESYIEEEDFTTEPIKEEPITQKDIEKYWYSVKEEQEMNNMRRSINTMSELVKDIDERKKDDVYKEKLEKLKKMNLFQLEELINKQLEKTDFGNFNITAKWQEKTYMRCEFEVYYKGEFWEKACKNFDKLLDSILDKSNWRIQKNKTDEQLWVLQWIIYWYDQEKDLKEIVKKEASK